MVTQPYTSRMTSAKLTDPKIIIYAGADGVSTLYEDDGISDTDLGLCRVTGISYNDVDKSVNIQCYNSNYDDGITARDITVELRGADGITGAVCDTHKCEFTSENGTAVAVLKDVAPDAAVTLRFI